jgi:hypothetical protein
MQIYMIDEDPTAAAVDLFDAHLNQTILESAQILSTAHWMVNCSEAERLYAEGRLWAPTHERGPCALWAAEAEGNYLWLKDFAFAAEDERLRRFPDRLQHAGIVLLRLMPHPPKGYRQDVYKTPFRGNLPEKYSDVDVVHAYRWYLLSEKRHLAKWTGRRDRPEWWLEC